MELKTHNELEAMGIDDRYQYFLKLTRYQFKQYFSALKGSPHNLRGDVYKQLMAVYLDKDVNKWEVKP